MTNNWTDIGNASLVVVMGANPSENHPASMAHVNRARENGAKLIVIDPRKTRTALQADRFIRIRPGTDIAFIDGLLHGIIEEMESRSAGDSQRDKFYEFLNWSGALSFWTDGDATHSSASVSVPSQSKYTDARFILTADGSDYERETIVASTGLPVVGGETADTIISNFPKKAATVDADPNTVYSRLKAHVAPYDAATVADICGCTEADVAYVVDAYINNSRCASVGAVSGSGAQDPRAAGYKCTTMMYAMGLTQHTYGGQNVKSFATLQSFMGNTGRPGGGINALRGIHNVQGSTDAGNLMHLIPFYSGNPSTMTSSDPDAFGKYMDPLWGNPLNGTGTRAQMDMSYDDAYNTSAMFLQQRGFANMTYNFFGKHDYNPSTGVFDTWMTTPALDVTLTNGLYDLWPKGNGSDHITMFRDMIAGTTKAAVVWGQNPAVTEPNQGKVRQGMYELDTLVCVDMFENESAAVSRKPAGVTYLLPACSHVEEAGSVVNSGRCLQWRERVTLPKGNSKADLELLFHLAHALDGAGAFSHITDQWTALTASIPGGAPAGSAYDVLYGDRYGWTPGGVTAFEDMSGTAEIWHGADAAPSSGTVYGSEWIGELMYREMCRHVNSGGTSWLWVNAFTPDYTSNKHTNQTDWGTYNRSKSRDNTDPNGTLAYPGWGYAWLVNRRILYGNSDPYMEVGDGYQGPDKVARLFVTTKTAAAYKGRYVNYSGGYRFYHGLADKPDTCLVTTTAPHVLPGRFPAHCEPYETPRADLATTWGRNTNGTAQWSCVKADTKVVGRDSQVGTPVEGKALADALVLTTIRCVEHFQGGPITRNNAWNVEAEPEPWVEINSVDARTFGIKTGDLVNVKTARGESEAQGNNKDGAVTAQGFRARVGVGIQSNQRVGQGVVAIPWHWGDRGLSTGSRANDLTIDAGDANTTIPEYKACLCWIEKA